MPETLLLTQSKIKQPDGKEGKEKAGMPDGRMESGENYVVIGASHVVRKGAQLVLPQRP